MSVVEDHIVIQSRPLEIVAGSIRIEFRHFVAEFIGEKELAGVRYVPAGYFLVPDDAAAVNFEVDMNVPAGVPSWIDRVEFNNAVGV